MEKKKRIILHSDLNNFYASVETVYDPTLKGKAVAVCGDASERHGIVLAKSELAKKAGVKTGMVIRDAKKLCPDLVIVKAHHDRYADYSQRVRKIYSRFTDRIEPFGIDEAWLDLTEFGLFGSGEEVADRIREAVKNELGLTASVGVSFNKVFAKLGSDMKKPDATTVITEENFKRKIWHIGVENLLYVGKSTLEKMHKYNIYTIGDLANTDKKYLVEWLGKWGEMLWIYANGLDDAPVRRADEEEEIKSVSNSITYHRDLVNEDDVKIVFTYLCESVSERLIRYNVGKATTISIMIRDESLHWITRQAKLPYPTVLANDFFKSAMELFRRNFGWHKYVRSLGVGVSDFCDGGEQLSMEHDVEKYDKKVELEKRITALRKKYGGKSLQKAIMLNDKSILNETPSAGSFTHAQPTDDE